MRVALALVMVVAGVGCRRHVDADAGASTPEGAVRGALDAANRGEDPSPFLLDRQRCHALYASADAPQISERGRASDEASCEQGAAILRDELRRLPKGHITFSIGAPKNDPFVGISVPVTVQLDSDAFAPSTNWYALRVGGRYFTGKKINTSGGGERAGTADIVPTPGDAPKRMTVAELRRAIASATAGPKTGDFVVIDGQYMGTDGDIDGSGDGHVWVGIVEDAGAQNVEFTVSCRDLRLSPDIEPGAKLTVSGVLHLDDKAHDNPSLDPCFVK